MTILGRLDPPAADQNALSQNAQSRSQMTFYEFINLLQLLKKWESFYPANKFPSSPDLQSPALRSGPILWFSEFKIKFDNTTA
jgi:hypothetical protein